jgi:post-segregation antitoxin (ccd killing protein)
MAKERMHEMPVTKGTYQVKGLVSGVKKQNFYTEKKTKTNKDFRAVNFGVEYDENKTVYMSLNGMVKDKVYFSKKNDNGKTDTKPVDWKNRNKVDADGYRLIGVNVGLVKTTNSSGKEVNDKKVMTDFDACAYISEKMEDDMSVFVKGNLEYSSFTNKNNEVSRSVKFVPNQVSLCQEVDFDADNYKRTNDFTQNIVFVGVDQEKDSNEKATGRFVVDAKIVNYNSIESAEFIIEDAKLAKLFKNNLKPYWAIETSGNINVVNNVETVENEDCWGEVNPMDRITAPTKREFVITGAKPSTIDKESYTEKAISEAIKKMNDANKAEENFEGKAVSASTDDDWGTVNEDDDDGDEPW